MEYILNIGIISKQLLKAANSIYLVKFKLIVIFLVKFVVIFIFIIYIHTFIQIIYIVCIRVSTPPQKHHHLFLAKTLLKSANCPSPPF